MDLEQLITSFRMEGLVDSRGSFTVSLELARRKMAKFQALEPERYLLHLVSAAVASGSSSITIKRTSKSLEIASPGSFIPEKEVLGGFEGLFTGTTTERAIDLILGLQSALSCGVEQISLLCGAPGQDSYRWNLSEHEEKQTATEPLTEARMSIRILFERPTFKSRIRTLFSLGGSYAQMPRECQLVDRQAEFSMVPISINSQSVNRASHLPEAIVSAVVGSPPSVTSSPRVLRLSGETWQGALALVEGRLRVVVSGLCYDLPKVSGLSGILYSQELQLDLSRLQVTQNENFHWLMTAVGEVKEKMFREALKAWVLHSEEEQKELLDKLASLTANAGMTVEEAEEILQSLEDEETVPLDHLELCYLWARENEFNQSRRHLQLICKSGYRLALRHMTSVGLDIDALKKTVYFAENGNMEESLLEWVVELFLHTYRRWGSDTERWHKLACELVPGRLQGKQKRLLLSALDYLKARYFDRTGQERMANHLYRVWRMELERHGEKPATQEAEYFERQLTLFSRESETVRKVLSERDSRE